MRFSGFEHMLSWYAEKTPDNVALMFHEDCLRTLGFSELYREVQARSIELIQGGKNCLGIISDDSKDCIEAPTCIMQGYFKQPDATIAAALNTTDLAVAEKNGCPVLTMEGDGNKTECMKKLMTVMAAYPRDQQIVDIILFLTPLPKTAAGKIKRWELQQRIGGAL